MTCRRLLWFCGILGWMMCFVSPTTHSATKDKVAKNQHTAKKTDNNGTLFQWKDERGNIHYGDNIPSQYIDQEYKKINDHGITVEITERKKNPAEIARDNQQKILKEQQEKQTREQRNYDRMLLETYDNENAIHFTHQERMMTIEASIKLTEAKINSLQKQLGEFLSKAANEEVAGKKVTQHLESQIKMAKDQIQQYEQYVAAKNKQLAQAQQDLTRDLNRFKELTELKGK